MRYGRLVTTIAQRELRNNVSDILRRAEGGERFTITVNGRTVAALGPPRTSRFADPEALVRVLRGTPVDSAWGEELARMRHEGQAAARDPWRG